MRWTTPSAGAPIEQSGRRATDETIEGVEAQLALAEEAVDQADHTAANLSDLSSSDPKRAAAEAALYEARQQRDAIKTNLNWYTGEPTDIDQAMLDARVALAEAQVLQAQLEREKWKDGPDPSALELAQASVDNAGRSWRRPRPVRRPNSISWIWSRQNHRARPGLGRGAHPPDRTG